MRSFRPRCDGGASSAAFAIALPPALSGSHTIAQDLCGLTDACDTPFLEKTKQPQAIGSGLVTRSLLRDLQLRDIFLDQQSISGDHYSAPRLKHITSAE